MDQESVMRTLLFASLFTLASCAGIANKPDLDERLSSWTGASVDELVSTLGVPSDSSTEWYEWRFTRPGMSAARSTNSVIDERFRVCASSSFDSSGCASRSGSKSKHHTTGVETSVSGSECIYRANVDGTRIVMVVTSALSGKCRFNEIPFLQKT